MKKTRKLTLSRETLCALESSLAAGGAGSRAGICTSYNAKCQGTGGGDTFISCEATCEQCSNTCATGGACTVTCAACSAAC